MKVALKFTLVPILAALLLTVSPSHGQDKTKEEGRDYFPLKEGMSWTYKTGDRSIIVRVTGFDKKNTARAILKTYFKDKDKEELVATEHVGIATLNKEHGVYRFSFEGSEAEPPLLFLPLPPKDKKKWQVESKIGGRTVKGSFVLGEQKDVKVPAGTYNTVTVTSENLMIDSDNASIKYYFAPKVGMVKQEVTAGDLKQTIELQKFEEGKK
jgi:DUF3108-like